MTPPISTLCPSLVHAGSTTIPLSFQPRSGLCYRLMSNTVPQCVSAHVFFTMCPSDSLEKQAIGLESATIGPNTLVVAANKNDRFRLHDDEALQVSDLDNLIHPIFHYSNFSNTDPHMQQALKLASMFLQYDTTLEFFVSPLFGRVLTADGKTYLSDPLLNADDDKRKLLLRDVREALH